ncbi:carbohydrate ABC transporter permease [Streptomyces marincola]|uniref:carbohydrate ABC transporter permease n=1 Tax=Streptomyces marincola TaxID=2878388 RepID=UPI001CF1C0A8|nr:sugar ABC transporter permease [Streptomyces marincola]UCM88179.1 sugar ABC transporter permease [Streptomyces marincola]
MSSDRAVRPPSPPAARRPGIRPTTLTAWLFVAPFLLLVVVLIAVPTVSAFRMSLYTDTLAQGPRFTGLDNFWQVLRDEQFTGGVRRILLLGVVQVPLMLGVALLAALLLDHFSGRYPTLFRLSVFLPYAVPGVVAALMWGYLYSPTFGPLGTDLLTDRLALPAIGNIITWSNTGYNMIIMYAALQAIPKELHEAARLDGAGPVRTALWIKVPMIAPALVLSVLLSIIGTMQLFTEPQVLRPQAPEVFDAAWTPNMYAQNLAFSYSQFSYSAAVAFLISTIVFVASYVLLAVNRRRSGLR